MYFKDLSFDEVQLCYVGWLDKGQPYSQGEIGIEDLKKLVRLLIHRKSEHTEFLFFRGFHICPFCKKITGSTTIKIKGTNGVTYLVPEMIVHYVVDHNYLPPREFLDAIGEV